MAAVAVSTAAGTALVILRARQRAQRNKHQGVRGLAERTVRDAAGEARKLIRRN